MADTVWIKIRADILSSLIRVQTVCKGQQKMLTSKEIKDDLFMQRLLGILRNTKTHFKQDFS